jgi:hypothetical protein
MSLTFSQGKENLMESGYVAYLSQLGATVSECAEILAYNQNPSLARGVTLPATLPLPDQPFVATWNEYIQEAQQSDVYLVLRQHLAQLNFPIRAGISQTLPYALATRKGCPVDYLNTAKGLQLDHPEELQLSLLPSLAGRIPLLIVGHRSDFISLVRALSFRNEPVLIPASMGASMVRGLTNWDRVRQYRRQWEDANPGRCSEQDWQAEFREIEAHRELYQDTLVILCRGDYSGVPAETLGVSPDEWRTLSLIIRQEHEATHYFTWRVYGFARNHVYDELLADYAGITAAVGRYMPEWFLHFIGLEAYPQYREGGRLQNYLGTPPLSPGAFVILQHLVQSAVAYIAQLDQRYATTPDVRERITQVLALLLRVTLLDMAMGNCPPT